MECSTTSAHPTTAAPTESGASRQYAGGRHTAAEAAEMGQLTIAPPRTQATEHVTSSIRQRLALLSGNQLRQFVLVRADQVLRANQEDTSATTETSPGSVHSDTNRHLCTQPSARAQRRAVPGT